MRVLFVEDNGDVRELVALLLEEEGLDVVSCGSAESAEAAFAVGRFDVLVTDVSLPTLSGPELAHRLRALDPALWIVFSSGYDMSAGLARWGSRVGVLRKPFETEDLHRLMEQIRAAV